MKLYITRHGQTEWNKMKKLQGWMDSPLTEEGVLGAEKLANRLSDIKFDKIYTSTQKRALDTAEILNKNNSEVIALDELRELNLGPWASMKIDDVKKEYPQQYDLYFNKPELYRSPGGEDFRDLFHRVEKALKNIMTTEDKNILIVSHGMTIKAIISILKDKEIKDFTALGIYPGTSLTVFEIDGASINCIVEGDDSHLN